MKFLEKDEIESSEGWEEDKGYKRKVLYEDRDGKALVQINVIFPKTTIPTHYHKQMRESVYVLEGEAYLVINKKEHLLKKGDLFLIEPDEIHTARNDSDEDFKYLVFKSNSTEGGDKVLV